MKILWKFDVDRFSPSLITLLHPLLLW